MKNSIYNLTYNARLFELMISIKEFSYVTISILWDMISTSNAIENFETGNASKHCADGLAAMMWYHCADRAI